MIGLSADHATLAMARFLGDIDRVIVSFANRATERFAREGTAKFAGLDAGKAMARLHLPHAAASLDDISPLKSVGRHALHGYRPGHLAMTQDVPLRRCVWFSCCHEAGGAAGMGREGQEIES